jgi:hypothetical protein
VGVGDMLRILRSQIPLLDTGAVKRFGCRLHEFGPLNVCIKKS